MQLNRSRWAAVSCHRLERAARRRLRALRARAPHTAATHYLHPSLPALVYSMGNAQSMEDYKSRPFGTSVVVEPAKGDSTDVRRQLKHKDALLTTAFPGVNTLYDGWQ
jgi:hypothetical protein